MTTCPSAAWHPLLMFPHPHPHPRSFVLRHSLPLWGHARDHKELRGDTCGRTWHGGGGPGLPSGVSLAASIPAPPAVCWVRRSSCLMQPLFSPPFLGISILLWTSWLTWSPASCNMSSESGEDDMRGWYMPVRIGKEVLLWIWFQSASLEEVKLKT